GVDEKVVEGEVIDARREDGKVATLEEAEVAQDDVVAVLEGDGLIAYAGLVGDEVVVVAAMAVGAVREAFTEDETGAGDGEVVLVFCVEERVTPMVVSVVLVGSPWIVGLGRVVDAAVVAGRLAAFG